MKKENRREILFRYGGIVVIILLMTARIIYFLVDNTVISAHHWNKLAEKELSRIDTVEPVRGEILASDGSVLATNMILYTPSLDLRHPKFNEDSYRACVPALADSLARHFPRRNARQWKEYLLSPLKRPDSLRSRDFAIVRDVSYFDTELIKTFPFPRRKAKAPRKGSIIGLKTNSRPVRIRPYGAMARRSIGAVGVTQSVKRIHGKYGL
ncbi:MAG: hypothetical protein K2G01_09765, partial [Paramuribaculum sp.]|nr:hypothetical protein [Paramuribaculum sp.]